MNGEAINLLNELDLHEKLLPNSIDFTMKEKERKIVSIYDCKKPFKQKIIIPIVVNITKNIFVLVLVDKQEMYHQALYETKDIELIPARFALKRKLISNFENKKN
jgi:hypothetical protein